MVACVSPTTIYQIFSLAAVADSVPRIVKPGIAGVFNLLDAHLSGYAISYNHIVRIFNVLSFEADCSFD